MRCVSAHITIERSNAVTARDVVTATVSPANAANATSPAVAGIRVAFAWEALAGGDSVGAGRGHVAMRIRRRTAKWAGACLAPFYAPMATLVRVRYSRDILLGIVLRGTWLPGSQSGKLALANMENA